LLPNKNTLAIGLIGAGRLGSSLALALERAGHSIRFVHSARTKSANSLSSRLKGAVSASAEEVTERCELLFLTVPDAAIRSLAEALPFRAGQYVVHCSGALSLEVLDAARARGALRGCLHPLQSFPEHFADPDRFRGIHCGIEGDAPLGEILAACALRLGAAVVDLAGVDRAAYHAAAVFASNYLVALHAAAAQIWSLAGLPASQCRAALAPLTLGSAERLAGLPLERALTGPLARGDDETIAQHLHALRALPELRALYVKLGAELLKLPLALTDSARAQLAPLFEPEPRKP
jgi:predicted short-subunit dehydrogenase-like oxidoreductase (DUF2520 family)